MSDSTLFQPFALARPHPAEPNRAGSDDPLQGGNRRMPNR